MAWTKVTREERKLSDTTRCTTTAGKTQRERGTEADLNIVGGNKNKNGNCIFAQETFFPF